MAGLILPVMTLIVIYFVRFNHLPMVNFINSMVSTHKLSSLINLSVIPNLLLFFAFIWTNMLYLARGVLLATVLFAVIVVLVKYLI